MRRRFIQVTLALVIFAGGAISGVVWKSRRLPPQQTPVTKPVEEIERPLTKANVLQSFQSRNFRTDKLHKNSNDEVVWRWLKDSIRKYPQTWVKLNISENGSYGIFLYPPKTLSPMELNQRDRELTEMGLPHLIEGKQYLPVEIYAGDIICPNWTGLVDIDEPKLVYFAGHSA